MDNNVIMGSSYVRIPALIKCRLNIFLAFFITMFIQNIFHDSLNKYTSRIIIYRGKKDILNKRVFYLL